MARTLVLIRHAKSAEGSVDIERPLAPRGVRDARAVGQWLRATGISPDRIVVSPARRARETWQLAAAELADSPEPEVDDRIYDNGIRSLLDIVHETAGEIATLVLVGHNPSFGGLAYELDDRTGDEAARAELEDGFPTSAIAVYELPGEWDELHARSATLTHCAAPRG